MMMTNTYYTPTGSHFTIDPRLSPIPDLSRQAKIQFLTGLDPDILSNPKLWPTQAVRALGTGLVPIATQGKRISRPQIVDSLLHLRMATLSEPVSRLEGLHAALAETTFDESAFLDLITRFQGPELVGLLRQMADSLPWKPISKATTLARSVSNLIKLHYPHSDQQAVLKLWSGEWAPVRAENNLLYQVGLSHTLRNQKPISVQPLLDLLTPDPQSWKAVALAIGVATGRRMCEVLGQSSGFREPDGHSVIFYGQAKTRGLNRVGPYRIPTLIPGSEVLRLRALLDYKLCPTGLVNHRYHCPLGHDLPKNLRAALTTAGVPYFKALRDAWATMLLLYRPEGYSSEGFLSLLLGHKVTDSTTARSYLKYYIPQADIPAVLSLLPNWEPSFIRELAEARPNWELHRQTDAADSAFGPSEAILAG